MSFLNDKTKFTVKTSNLSTVAKFSSTLDDAYFLVLAQNSNNIQYGCNASAAVFGASSTSNFEAYIGVAKDNIFQKIARFNNTDINLNANVIIQGNIVPTSNLTYSLGTPEYKWKDLYLSGSTIYLGETVLSSDKESGTLTVKNSSNEIAPMVASRIKLVSSGKTSNYSIFSATDYGVNLTYYDQDGNIINHLDLGLANTSMLPEGSNLYYTFERFDQRLLTKTLDNLIDGTSNRYITNDVYYRDLQVTGTLRASNMVVYGDRTTLNTETYQTEQLEISSDANGPVLTIHQKGQGDVFQIFTNSNISLLVNNQGFTGINTSNPQYNLDVAGIANATYLRGDASQLFNVNFTDRTTDLLLEGSNLYYTSERVGIIATSSNIDTSNYIRNTSNDISARLTDTSNVISDRLTDTSNLISNRLTETSNLISDRLTDTSNLISNRLTDTSNLISDRITTNVDLIQTRITDLTTDQITEANNLFYTTQRFDERLLTKTLDDIVEGTSNRYIVNDIYDRDLTVTGTLTTSNLIVHGSFTTLDTVTYQTKKLEIVSDSEQPALLVRQTGNSNIIEVYDDTNIVLSIANGGFVGINKQSPEYALDVVGTIKADYLIGDGSGLVNVSLADKDTSLLKEGSNLYYTPERVGIISTACNIDTSNYILQTSNYLIEEITLTATSLTSTLISTSNLISERITNLTSTDITEGTNLYYTTQRFDERLDSKTADYLATGTSNRYIVNDIYNRDLTVTGTLNASNLVVSGDITTLNTNTYQSERMEIISDVAGPALKITQRGNNDIMHVYDDANIAFSIVQGGSVGVNTLYPSYTLDVAGTARAHFFIGDASGLSNVNLADRDTSLLKEGSNLYYTSERVGIIATSSNAETSNYILESSNYLITKILDTSNLLTDTINNVVSVEIQNTCNYLILTSNILIENIINTSNILTAELNDTITNEINTTIANLEYTSNTLINLITSTSNELTSLMNNVVAVQVTSSANNLTATSNELIQNIRDTSNQLTNTINNVVSIQITNASNMIVNTSNILTANLTNYYTSLTTRINNLTTNNIPEGKNSNLYYTDARFSSMLETKSLDDIRDGTSNRYIVNDRYTGDLYISGTLSTSNLIVNGTTTTLNTTTYQSKKLEIISDAIGPALKVQQNGIFDIMQVYDDSNIVLSIVNGGRVGINTSNPAYTFDVVGTSRSTFFIGDASGLTNVNLTDRTTSMLVEGSNLYYTSERVGIIASACNVNTSNYILVSSNVISDRITNVSNVLSTNLSTTSNTLYTNLIQASNLISLNLFITSNYLMTALITTSNLAINTSNEIMTNLITTYNTYTSNFLANSNLLSSNILVTSNTIANLIASTYSNITTNISDTSNTLINNVLISSNNLINNTTNTFVILTNNLTNVSNIFASNIPIIYKSLYDNLYNVSNVISAHVNNASNSMAINIRDNCNLFINRIVDTSNVISERITITSNDLATNMTLTSNMFSKILSEYSNQIYTTIYAMSNSLSVDILQNSNVISNRITALNLDMINPGSSNTYIVNNIYDANLTITGKLVVDSLDVVDLGLLVLNDEGQYINTDMKTYIARITSNVLVAAPAIILNASNNFKEYDNNQSNYISTKIDKITGAATSILYDDLTANRVLVTNNSGKLAASTVSSASLEMIAGLTSPVQTQINSLNISSSNLAASILDRLSFLNNSIGQGTGGTGNNLSVVNTVTTCNLVNYDPLLFMKFEDLNDSSKYASKNYMLMKAYPGYTDHTKDIMLWYKFNGNTNNYINNVNSNLYLIYGYENYSPARVNGLSSLNLNGATSYTMGLYNNTIVPAGIRYANRNSMTLQFWMNASTLFTGRQYVFSYSTSNFVNAGCALEAYINTSNLCLSVSKGINSNVYTIPMQIQPNIFYNIAWEMTKTTDVINDAKWNIYINGLNYSNVSAAYPLNQNYIWNTYGGQASVYSSNFFNGNIDDFRVYGRALNWYEVYENAGINYPSYDNHISDLLLWYNFDGHLHNYDGNSNYQLSLATGTLTYIANNNTSLYNVYLNGSTYFSMNANSMINFASVSDLYPRGLTFSIVFNATSVATATQYLFSMTDTVNSSTPTRSIEVFLTTNQLNFRIRQNGTTTMQTVSLNSGLVAYKFYNLVWVITQGNTNSTATWNIFLNGLNVYTSEGNRFYPDSGIYRYNYVGSLYNTSYLSGFVDDFRVYKKSLANEDVAKISTKTLKYGTFVNHTNNLVSWFNFDNDYTNTLFDASIPLLYLNFADKKMIAYTDTDNYIFYNNSNVAGSVYANIGNFTVLNTEIAGYSVPNSYALISNANRYIYYVNQFELINVLKFIGNKGFVIHFAMKADKMSNIPIFYFGNGSKRYIQVIIYYGCVYMIVGEGADVIHIYTDNNFNTNMWYVVDIVGKIDLKTYRMSFEIYINGIRQNIVLSTIIEYKPTTFLYGYESTGIYVGAYNARNDGVNYSSDGYEIGAVLTATYYSTNTKYYDSTGTVSTSTINILNTNPSNSATFNSYLNQVNANNYWAFRDSMYLTSNELMSAEYVIDSSNYFALNDINPAEISSMFIEVVGNFYVESDAYYHFTIDLYNEIGCELMLSGVNNFGITNVFMIVASYYGGSINVLQYPVMLNKGYYKLSLKILRKVVDIHKYIICKYYKYAGYSGSKYSILSKNVAYMNYNSLSSSVKDGMIGFGDKIFIANVVQSFATGNATIRGDDYGVLTLGSPLTSNAIGLGSSNFTEYAGILANVMGSNFPIKQFSNIVNVSAGSNHTLVLLNNGTAYSCGANNAGQLGLGTIMNSASNKFLKQVKGVNGFGYLNNIIQVSAGDNHSMFLKNDGVLYGCGLNVFGQLGLGDTTYAYNVLKQSFTDVKYVSAGVNTTLVIKNDDSAWGCGRNDTGQLAQGANYTSSSSFIPIMDVGYSNALVDVKEVQAGGRWSLFLKKNGTCYASGGMSNMMSLYQVVGSNVAYMSNVTQISAKADFGAMFLANNAEVFRTGSNLLNVPGTISKVVATTAISKVAQGKNIYYIGQNGKGYTSSSLSFACGNNDSGQLALGDTSKFFIIKQMQGINGSGYISGITQVAAGFYHTLFLHSTGVVYGVGRNGRGQLGLNEVSDIYSLQQVKGVNGTGFISGIIQISAGEYDSMFLHSTNVVYACGYNDRGQLGLNNTTQYLSLQQVKGVGGTGTISGIIQISMGRYHTLLLHSTGIVYATGYNTNGQLGLNNYNTQYTTLQQVLGVNASGNITGITQISAGWKHSLFLHSSGTVYACGAGSSGQLGLNNATEYTSLQQVKGVGGTGTISGISQISASQDFSLFLHSSGAVYSCGTNANGQLGLNNTTQQNALQQVLGINGSGNISGIAKISAGNSHSVFLSSDGTVYVCGDNSYGQLGINNTTIQFNTLQQVKGVDGSSVISGITQIAAGNNSSFYLNSSGNVYGSGNNDGSKLGYLLSTPQPVLGINGVNNITSITKTYWSPSYSIIYLHASGAVYVSGNNADGQFGLNNKTSINTLQQVFGPYGSNYMYGIVNAAAGYNYSLFVDSTGAAYTCGTNNYGQMGINLTVPRPVSGLNGLGLISGIIQVSAGYSHSLFLNSSGDVYSCGANNFGQLGLNNNVNYTLLQRVLGVNGSGFISSITQIFVSVYHSLFLHSTGIAYSCGYNNNGQLGLNNTANYNSLQQVKGVGGTGFISGIIQINSGNAHTLFLHSSGVVYGCGRNSEGQLGLNNTSSVVSVLQQVLGVNGIGFISGIIQISAGNSHSLFVHSSGAVYSTGHNAYGQLGLNTTTTLYTTLQQVLGVNGSGFISGIVKIAAGSGNHSLFLHSSGIVYSCGDNNNGQLGLNNNVNRITLQQVLGLNGSGFISGIIEIIAGNANSLFLHSSGTVYATGRNSNGQLSFNSIVDQTTLQQVLGVNGSGFISGVTQISAGWYHTLFLHSSGNVYACGDNGQLGFNYIVPNPVQGVNGLGLVSGIKQVATGYYHSLFLHSSGAVYSCGRNANGQLGLNSTLDQNTLKQVLGVNGSGFISGITQISAANNSSFFLHSSGSVYSCGSGSSGNLGLNNNNQYNSLQQVLGVNGSGFISGIIQVAAGEIHTLFLHSSGIVYSCGYDTFGQLGLNNNTTSYYITLQQVLGVNGVGFISGIIQVAAGNSISLFLHSSGVVYACGANRFGQLGLFDGVAFYSSLQQVRNTNTLSYLEKIIYVSAGYNASSFIQFADFGDLLYANNTIDTAVGNITQISAYNHLLLTDVNNMAFSTGANTYGQLANNTSMDQNFMQYVLDGEGRYDIRNIVKIVPYCSGNSTDLLDAKYTLFLSKDGSVYFSGDSGGHSGGITTTPYLTYMSVLSGYKIVDMAAGGGDSLDSNYNVFVTSTGNVFSIPSNTFVKDATGLKNLANIVRVGCRKNNSLMYLIDKDGFAYQSTGSFNISPAVTGLGGQGVMRNIRQIEGGLSFTVFLSNSGDVYVVGDNTYGQLGTGNYNAASVPTYMLGLNGTGYAKNIVKISCGNYYTLLLARDTKVLATGYNIGGILGIGTTANTNVLKEVLQTDGSQPLTGIKDISCGVANIIQQLAPVLLLGQNNNIYIQGATTASTGLLTLLNNTQTINRTINSVHAAGAWLFLNTVKYDNQLLYDGSNQFAFTFDEKNSPYFYVNDSNYVLHIQDVRMYTPDVMGTSNVIANQLVKGIYNPSTNPAPNNMIFSSNTSFDFNNYYSGYASLALTASNNSFVYMQSNFYNFGANDTTISMWVKGSDVGLKYPNRVFSSNDNNIYCTSTTSNVDCWRCFDNSSSSSLNINTFTQLYSIGYNNVGQLGDNSTANRTVGYVPVIVPASFNETITLIAGTANVTGWTVHMLTDAGRAYSLQQAGLTWINSNNFAGEKISFIASGRSTYFITESGLLYSYGDNSYWQLGNGNNTTQNTPVLISSSRWNGERVIYVATGNYHTYIITESGAIFSIGYNNNGQLGTGNNTNQTAWTLFTSLSNVLRIYCAGDQTYMITKTGLLYSVGVRGNVPFLESSIPSNKRIIKVSFSPGNCAFALADDGTVYGYGNNPLSMPNTTSAQSAFIEMTSGVWTGNKIVDVVTAGDHTFYTTDKGLVYVVGNNNYGQLNIPTSTSSSKTPLLVNVGGRINLVYGGLSTTAYNIVIVYPVDRYIEFGGSSGEFVKVDILENVAINYAQVSLSTPASTTSLSYAVSMKLYGCSAMNALDNVNVLWNLLGTYDGQLSYSANIQNITIASSSLTAYRYYAILINSRYNINVNEIGLYTASSISSKKCLLDARIDSANGLNIMLEANTITASVVKESVATSIAVSHPNIYNRGVLYTLSYKYNTDDNDATWKVYTNGMLIQEKQPMPYPVSGNYATIYIGRSVNPVDGVYNYFNGNIDDFRIYNRALVGDEILGIYSADKFNVEGSSGNQNRYALSSSKDTFVYNVNYSDVYGMMRNIDANGFTIHFMFKTNDVSNATLYYVGGNRSSRIMVKVVAGVMYILLGTDLGIVSRMRILKNTWYTVDIMVNITASGMATIQLYLNGIVQQIYAGVNTINTSQSISYSNLVAPDNVPLYGMYIGANLNNIYKDASEIVAGAVFTNTYYSSNLVRQYLRTSNVVNNFPGIMSRAAIGNADFSNLIVEGDLYYSYKISSNVVIGPDYQFIYNGSNFLYDTYITSNLYQSDFILTELDGNIWLEEGFYYFVNDIDGEITAELYLGTEVDRSIRDFTLVGCYYGSNGTFSESLNRTTALPVYVAEGYYKFHSKALRRNSRKYLHHKYIKLDNYIGEYYSLVSHFVDYQAYSSLSSGMRNSAVLMHDRLYIPKMAANNILLDTGGSIDASLLGWGRSAYFFDNGCINRGTVDTASTTYVNVIPIGQPDGSDLLFWGFFAGATGRTITPLILEGVGGTNYILRGVGRSRTISVSGLQSYAFDTVSGSNIFLTNNYRFGWKDGTLTTTNTGVITFDNTSAVSQSTYSMSSAVNMSVGSTYAYSSAMGNRTYAFKLEFATTSNYQFGSFIYEGSNYNVGLTSNYIAIMTSNYTIGITSNYNVMMSSNYDINATSNYTIASGSNYNVGLTSNYTVNMTSNYFMQATSNYTVGMTSNYGDNESSNYTVDMTSNYLIDYTSNYSAEMTSNYTISVTSNYTVEMTSNYTVVTGSNYSVGESSNYTVVAGSNYTVSMTVQVTEEYTSNYIVPYVANYLLPQSVFDLNNFRYMRGVSSVCNGASHTVILRFDGSVFSCGQNLYGQLGIGSVIGTDKFVAVLDVAGSGGSGGMLNVRAISCGMCWSHFVKGDGTVYGCGMNTYGNLGDNTVVQRNRVVQVVGVGGTGVLTGVRAVAGGFGDNCVSLFLRTDGTVVGCGNNVFGTLGDNSVSQRNAVVSVLGVGGSGVLSNIRQVCTNATTSVFLANDGTCYACGGNTFGQIGDNSVSQRNTVVQVRGIAGSGFLTNITQIAANGDSMHTLFLRGDGVVYGCGFNGFGQLGRNNTVNLPYAMRVMSSDGVGTISGIIQVNNNANSSYFLRYDGSLMACGGGDLSASSNYGNYGQLGNGGTSNALLPAFVRNANGTDILVGVSQLGVGGINNMNVIFNNGNKELVRDNNMYIIKTENEVQNVLIQDFRIYNTGSFTSNILNVYASGGTSVLNTAYSTYSEITDANRWMKSKDYYLYTNGALNRNIYYTEGNVGIGTSAPTATLEIYTSDSTLNSIKTNNAIWAQTGVISSSDARIKKNIRDIDDFAALEQILKIEPKTYNYIDKRRGEKSVYGFIAQQIGEVIPNAVSIQTECIPNIFKEARVQDKSMLVFDMSVADRIYVGCYVDIVINNERVRCEVMQVSDMVVKVNREFDEDKVFVYGTVVDDFHTLDKSYVYTLNVCATQDLYRQLQNNKAKIEEQNRRIEMLMAKVEANSSM